MTSETTPNGCRWCGIEQRGHGRQYTPGVGYHSWKVPTDEQRKQRMRDRRR